VLTGHLGQVDDGGRPYKFGDVAPSVLILRATELFTPGAARNGPSTRSRSLCRRRRRRHPDQHPGRSARGPSRRRPGPDRSGESAAGSLLAASSANHRPIQEDP
jgi:hypothetical protein